jgi:hypothetical protein
MFTNPPLLYITKLRMYPKYTQILLKKVVKMLLNVS